MNRHMDLDDNFLLDYGLDAGLEVNSMNYKEWVTAIDKLIKKRCKNECKSNNKP